MFEIVKKLFHQQFILRLKFPDLADTDEYVVFELDADADIFLLEKSFEKKSLLMKRNKKKQIYFSRKSIWRLKFSTRFKFLF